MMQGLKVLAYVYCTVERIWSKQSEALIRNAQNAHIQCIGSTELNTTSLLGSGGCA